MKIAVIILGHGSRRPSSDEPIRRIAAEVRKIGGFHFVQYAFLQYLQPSLPEAIERCIRERSDKIMIVPFFMQAGVHVMADIPDMVRKARGEHPEIDILVTDLAGNHPLMTDIVLDLANKAK